MSRSRDRYTTCVGGPDLTNVFINRDVVWDTNNGTHEQAVGHEYQTGVRLCCELQYSTQAD